MDYAIAGIINAKTGEIIETVTRPQDKTALRLKVRDVFNVQHGADAFFAFELDLAVDNTAWVMQKMKSTNTTALQSLRYRYQLGQAHKNVLRVESELALAKEVKNESTAVFGDHPAKLELILHCLDNEIRHAAELVDSAKYRVHRLTNKLKELQTQTHQP